MKIGPVEFHWHPGKSTYAATVEKYLKSQHVREGVARMARSEVKSYLAEIAEEAEIPFASPVDFLRVLRQFAAPTPPGAGMAAALSRDSQWLT
jgi:hypothetical protein